jgi:MFS family permease
MAASPAAAEKKSRIDNPAWLFGILSIPYGVFNGIIIALIPPFLLRKHGISPDRIANVIAISSIPNVWYFLWSPVVDTGMLRRTWVIIAAGVSALCGTIAIAATSLSLAQLTILLLAGNVIAMLLSSACGAILTTLTPTKHDKASGWYNDGNIGSD